MFDDFLDTDDFLFDDDLVPADEDTEAFSTGVEPDIFASGQSQDIFSTKGI